MFERFTDRSRRVMVLAQEEAQSFDHSFIGSEHLLLGLIREEDGIAAQVLRELGVTADAVRARVKDTIAPPSGGSFGSPPFTPRAKKVLELALREAQQLGHNYIGTEHILLGLVQEGEGVAAQILQGLGVELPRVRQQVIQVLSGYHGSGTDPLGAYRLEESDPAVPESSSPPRCAGCSSELELVLRYRTTTVPTSEPHASPLKVEVVYCNSCGQVFSMFKSESSD